MNGLRCARDGFGSTLFELYFPFPRLPFIFSLRCQIPVITNVDKASRKRLYDQLIQKAAWMRMTSYFFSFLRGDTESRLRAEGPAITHSDDQPAIQLFHPGSAFSLAGPSTSRYSFA
jgi:hypothetical protein